MARTRCEQTDRQTDLRTYRVIPIYPHTLFMLFAGGRGVKVMTHPWIIVCPDMMWIDRQTFRWSPAGFMRTSAEVLACKCSLKTLVEYRVCSFLRILFFVITYGPLIAYTCTGARPALFPSQRPRWGAGADKSHCLTPRASAFIGQATLSTFFYKSCLMNFKLHDPN